VEAFTWLHLGEIAPLLSALRAGGARDVVMAGKIPKAFLYEQRDALRLDARALRLLAGLADRKDDSILRALAGVLAEEGFALRPQAEFVPELRAPEGPLGKHAPTPDQIAELRFAWPIAKALGAMDVGQTVVVKDRAVLALEAIEGTDAAIRRGGELGGPGACVLKVAKPDQDPRFDVPAVGADTLAALEQARAAALALEAFETLVLERSALIERADALGIVVVGVNAVSLGVGARA
jgi:DUF1009 family protein